MKYIDTKGVNDALETLAEVLNKDDINSIEKMLSQRVTDHYEYQIDNLVKTDLTKLGIKSSDVEPVF